MTTYWVRIDFNYDVESPEPQTTDLTFQGVDLWQNWWNENHGGPVSLYTTNDTLSRAVLAEASAVQGYWTNGQFTITGYNSLVQKMSIGESYIVGSAPNPVNILGPIAQSPSIHDDTDNQTFQYAYNTFIWEKITTLPAGTLSIKSADKYELIKFQAGGATTLALGSISFTDSDPSETVSASIDQSASPLVITAGDTAGNLVTLTAAQQATLAAAFQLGSVSETPSTGVGSVGWTYDPGSADLSFLAGDTALVTSTVDVTDSDGNNDTAVVSVDVNGNSSLTVDPSLVIDAVDKVENIGTIVLNTDKNGNVTNTSSVRIIHYTDSDAEATVTGTPSLDPTISASFIGGIPTNLSTLQSSYIAEDLTTSSLSLSSAQVIFDPNANNLSFIAPGETVIFSDSIDYSDNNGNSDNSEIDISLQGPAQAWEAIQTQKDSVELLSNIKTAQDIMYEAASKAAGLKVPKAISQISSAIGNALDILDVQTQFDNINNIFQSEYTAAGDNGQAQYKAVENATVRIESAAIKSSIKVAIAIVVADYGLAAATLAGAAVANVALSAASQVTLAVLTTALAPEILAIATPIVAVAIAAYAAGKTFDYIYDNYLDKQLVSPALTRSYESTHPSFSVPLNFGRVLDGYLSGATIFSDANANGRLDAGEVSTTTDSAGDFTLTSSSAPLVAVGGTDISTGLAFQGTLSAPAGSAVITPLTTLVEAAMQQGGTTLAAAQTQVEVALGIAAGTDLTSLDPIANAEANQNGSAAILAVSSQLANTAAIFSAAGASSSFYALLAGQIQASAGGGTSTIIDLTNSSTLVALAVAGGLSSTVANDIATITAASNTVLSQIAQTETGSTLLQEVAAVSKTAQSATVAALQAAGSDPAQLQTVVAANTGANLTTEIAQAQASLGGGSPLPGSGSSAAGGSTDPGSVSGGGSSSSGTDGSTGPGTSASDELGSTSTTVPQPLASAFSGGQASFTNAEAPVQPFTGVNLGDTNASGTDTVTITFFGAGGALAYGTGFSGLTQTGASTYSLTAGSAAVVTAEIDALVFTPALASPTAASTTTFVLSDTNSGGVTATSAPIAVTDTPADAFSPNAAVAFAGRGVFTISGQATSPSGVASIEFSADVNGQQTNLGAATVNPDGTYAFTDDVGGASQSNITAAETDGAGGTTSASVPFGFVTGIKGQPYTAEQDNYDPSSGAYLGSSYYGRNGSLVYASTYTANPDGTQTYAFSDGSFFDNKSYSSYKDTYDGEGNLLTEERTRDDGATVTTVDAPGQTVSSDMSGNDIFRAGNQGSNAFVFKPGFGQAMITGFALSGAEHDTIDLPASDFTNIANVLRNTHNAGNGVVITDPTSGEAIQLAGVSKADLKQHKGDFALV